MEWSVARSLSSRVSPATEYEFRHISLPRTTSRGAARRLLTEQAEHGHWELARLRLHPDGTRKIVLRRKIMRVRPTL
ncbi:hypothetical protein E1262_22225 [Jiangella aurantiaca]|uniref:DUF4177 domain-containing protein n=1 Tax=Jiangella aurantiaca TaxID=2530373 RepID=A0A4V2YRL8_9ACTN|nr:hypothetical protein E1262_22225 [Jiangella aurantiaca]